MLPKESIEFIVPVFNEEMCIDEFVERYLALRQHFSDVDLSALFVDDGSRDESLHKLLALADREPSIRVIGLSRNFGHQFAVTAGLDHSDADWACIIDADLQDPPELVMDMHAMARRDELDVVYAQRRSRQGETRAKLITAGLFYRLLERMCGVEIPRDTGDFRLIDRKVVIALRQMRETHRFLRGLVPWVGFASAPILYDREPRHAGKSKYPWVRMIRFAADALFSFSNAPLRLASYFGSAIAVLGLVGLVWMLALKLFTERVVPGLMVLLTSILVVGGVQLLVLGVLGEYIGRVFEQSKGRPLYVVSVTRNVAKPLVPAHVPVGSI